ncbi:MltR family transcriptional regulator [Paraclostridium sordellii]|uniref:MltR family transcriptional regulator n=1 Tax=Paraclostridium sordellii TaxID=1505 RepID=UPI0022E6AF88|nr:MltR family transcriptional regulator [Paeniclostridium sordellii]
MTTNNKNNHAIKWMDILRELSEEIHRSSDRSSGILVGSILDEQLRKILKMFVVEDKNIENDLLGTRGIISTFDARIKLCYYLGLIDCIEYKNLENIRKIRNKFAHSFESMSFDSQSIKDLCNNLNIPIEKYFPKDLSLKKIDLNPFKEDNSSRQKFIKTFEYLSMILMIRENEVYNRKIIKLEDKDTIVDKILSIINEFEEKSLKSIKLGKENERLLRQEINMINSIKKYIEEHKDDLDRETIKKLNNHSDIKALNLKLENRIKETKKDVESYEISKFTLNNLRRVCDLWNEEYEKISNEKRVHKKQ